MMHCTHDDNALGGYVLVVIGRAPLMSKAHDDLASPHGHKTYRSLPVARSSASPREAKLLSPAVKDGAGVRRLRRMGFSVSGPSALCVRAGADKAVATDTSNTITPIQK